MGKTLTKKEKVGLGLMSLMTLAAVIALGIHGPIPQSQSYHAFADSRTIWGIPHFFDVISNLAFGRYEITKSPIFPLAFILAVVFLFNPVRNRVQKFIDKVFYRLEYDYQETVGKISETMRSLLNGAVSRDMLARTRAIHARGRPCSSLIRSA